jgi:hypothetical protein
MVQAAQPAPRIYVPRVAYAALAGPRELCTESFSIRLEEGETLAWLNSPPFPAGGHYVLLSHGQTLQAAIWRLSPMAERRRAIRLPLSAVSERVVTDLRPLPNLRGPDGRHMGADYRVHFLLHGRRLSPAPLSVSIFTNDPRIEIPILRRISPGSMEERNCRMTARLDPALADQVGSVYPY